MGGSGGELHFLNTTSAVEHPAHSLRDWSELSHSIVRKRAGSKRALEDLRVFCSTAATRGGLGARSILRSQYWERWSQPHQLGKGPSSCWEGVSVLAQFVCHTCISPGWARGVSREGCGSIATPGAGAHSHILERELPAEPTDSLLNPRDGKRFTAYYHIYQDWITEGLEWGTSSYLCC